LFAWAGDEKKQQEIMELNDEGEIYRFLRSERGVIFVIDQLNALEEKRDDDESIAAEKTRLRLWLNKLRARHKAVLSSSANNYSIHNRKPQ